MSIIVLTGATGGIGREISRKLVEKGCILFGIARNEEKLNAMKQELGANFHPISCDVSAPGQIRLACEAVTRGSGKIDCLINNAGILRIMETHRVTESDIDEQFDTMVKATILFTTSFLPSMMEQGKGLIINIASIAGQKASPKMAIYGAAKAAIINFTKSVALEYAEKGIRAVCICPGTVQTELMDKFLLAIIQKKVPLRRLAKPSEVASLVEYLLSDDSSYITGTAITMDGGVSL